MAFCEFWKAMHSHHDQAAGVSGDPKTVKDVIQIGCTWEFSLKLIIGRFFGHFM